MNPTSLFKNLLRKEEGGKEIKKSFIGDEMRLFSKNALRKELFFCKEAFFFCI